MPTSDPLLTVEFLRALDDRSIPYAVLHGADDIANHHGDLDIVVDRTAFDVAASFLDQPLDDCHPVMVWPYEPGGAANLFIVRDGMEGGAQIDILHDPSGRGRLGFNSGAFLATSERKANISVVADSDRLAYLLRKRMVKNDPESLRSLVSESEHLIDPEFENRLDTIATARASASIRQALAGAEPEKTTHASQSPVFMFNRLRHPVGAWIHFSGSSGQTSAARWLNLARAVFPHTGSGEVGDHPIPQWAATIAPLRWRPGLFASWGRAPRLIGPDLVVEGWQPERIVEYLETRLRLRSRHTNKR